MTLELLNKIMDENKIPRNVRLMSDSGWEYDATDMDGIYYNEEENILVFTQETKYNNYVNSGQWKLLCGSEK